MAVTESSRVVTFSLLCTLPVLFSQEYHIPDVTIRALKPKGLIVSIPDIPMINYFEFQANVNKPLDFGDIGDVTIEVNKQKNGVWVGQDDSVELKVGDVINYYIHIGIKKQKGYDKRNLSYIVTELYGPEDSSEPTNDSKPKPNLPIVDNRLAQSTNCGKTATEVYSKSSDLSKTYCSNDIIFEDNFDTLNEDWWIVEQYIPSKPEYPFASYQRSSTVSVANGILRIEPKLQESFPGFDGDAILTGTLNLKNGYDSSTLDAIVFSSCTGVPESCMYMSSGAQILHPIASGRIRTNRTFAFKYGFIEVKAKVPQGDWLYPDILLESFLNPYGTENYASGVLKIAGVHGNVMLNKGIEDIGNKVLYGGPIIDFKCRNNLLEKKISTTEWGNDFHVYSLRWAPEMITLFVDGEEWGRINPPSKGLQARLPSDTCNPTREMLKNSIAPFDELFGITLGVSVGGIGEFPDGIISRGTTPKPWKNKSNKARLHFYNAKDTWLPTWTQPALLVDYVRLRAL